MKNLFPDSSSDIDMDVHRPPRTATTIDHVAHTNRPPFFTRRTPLMPAYSQKKVNLARKAAATKWLWKSFEHPSRSVRHAPALPLCSPLD
jgi:hypothetical protein